MTVIAPCEWCSDRAYSTFDIGGGVRAAACPGCRAAFSEDPDKGRATRRQLTLSIDNTGAAPGSALYGTEAA